jgi:hypothetical protein
MTKVWDNNPVLRIYFEFWPFGLRRAIGHEGSSVTERNRPDG